MDLTDDERAQLRAMLSGGKHAARRVKRAQILLAAEAGISDEEIAQTVLVGGSTVYRTKRRFVTGKPTMRATARRCGSISARTGATPAGDVTIREQPVRHPRRD